MKQLCLFAMAFLMLAACTPVADKESKEDTAMANQCIEVVKKMVQAFESEDIATLRDVYSVDVESQGPRYGQLWPYDSLMTSNANWFEMSDSIHFSIDYIMYEKIEEGNLAGDWVLLWCDISWYDIETEKSYIIDYHAPHQITDGKIVYEHAYWNQWDMFAQMGAELEFPGDE